MAKKIIIRLIGLIVIVAGLNLIYNFTLFRKDLMKECEQIVDMEEKQPVTDIYYFAESSNFSFRDDDSIKTSISEISNLFFPKLKITAVNQSATHAGIYKYWLNHIDLDNNKPKAIIVTLNLRSFDAGWIHSKLETPLQKSITLLKRYPNLINRFLLSLNAFDNKTVEEREQIMLSEWERTELKFPFRFKYKTVRQWDNAMGQGGYLKPDGSWDLDKIGLACHYIKGYAFNINENNPRVKDFDDISGWCNKNGIKLYLNLMAENIQYADSLVGKELVILMKQNRDFLVSRYNKNNCSVVDNLEMIEGKEFTDQAWTTEHYGYKGRMIIARNLANKLQNQFNNFYIKAY
jgi:hypothetical protein